MSQWKDGLTPEQIETVERAAKAAVNNLPPVGFAADWESLGQHGRNASCSDLLAALRAAGHPMFPAPKVPTHGEEVAAMRIETFGDNVRLYGTPNVVVNAPGVLSKTQLRDMLRENYAAIIDAERAAARAEALEDAIRELKALGWIDTPTNSGIGAIRALAAKEAK